MSLSLAIFRGGAMTGNSRMASTVKAKLSASRQSQQPQALLWLAGRRVSRIGSTWLTRIGRIRGRGRSGSGCWMTIGHPYLPPGSTGAGEFGWAAIGRKGNQGMHSVDGPSAGCYGSTDAFTFRSRIHSTYMMSLFAVVAKLARWSSSWTALRCPQLRDPQCGCRLRSSTSRAGFLHHPG